MRFPIYDNTLHFFGEKGLRGNQERTASLDFQKNSAKRLKNACQRGNRNLYLANRIFSNILITNNRIDTSSQCKLNKLKT